MESKAPVTLDLTGEIRGTQDYIRIDCGEGDVTLNLYANATAVAMMLVEAI